MRIPHDLRWAATFVALLMISANAGAQEPQRSLRPASQSSKHREVTGILTDRLTKSQLKAWESIMRIVLAKDGDGRPLHPRLFVLYQQVGSSGCSIFLELSTQRSTMCALGLCRIERHTDGEPKEVVLIQLNLGMIDRAIASDATRRADGFIPFAGLKKKERYAEVLGHELAHVVRLVTDPYYRGLYWERQVLADAGSEDIQAIGRLTRMIEQPAEAMEAQIWRELTSGREPKI